MGRVESKNTDGGTEQLPPLGLEGQGEESVALGDGCWLWFFIQGHSQPSVTGHRGDSTLPMFSPSHPFACVCQLNPARSQRTREPKDIAQSSQPPMAHGKAQNKRVTHT